MSKSKIDMADTAERAFATQGLRAYLPESPDQANAGYWIIPVARLQTENFRDYYIGNIEDHLLNLLALNPQATIIFDGFDMARSPLVAEWVIGFIAKLGNSPDGYFETRRLGSKLTRRLIEARNIGLVVSLAPSPAPISILNETDVFRLRTLLAFLRPFQMRGSEPPGFVDRSLRGTFLSAIHECLSKVVEFSGE
jgi:hypothetical protein